MSTAIDSSIRCSNSTDAQFRAWAAFIHSVFILGLINTADSGQVDLATVVKPSVINTAQGYKVYRTNDGLTNVYIKIEYGSGGNAGYPSIWVTVGTATDGAGTIGGVILLSRTQITCSINDAVNTNVCFGSGATDRVCFAVFLSISTAPFWFSLERRRDANLANADTGVIIDWGLATTGHKSLCAPFAGVIPTPELGLPFVLSSNNPAAYGSVIPEGLRIPCLGPTESPGINVAACMANDWGAFATPTLTINSVDHVFKHCGSNISTLRNGVGGPFDAQTRLLLRYE